MLKYIAKTRQIHFSIFSLMISGISSWLTIQSRKVGVYPILFSKLQNDLQYQ